MSGGAGVLAGQVARFAAVGVASTATHYLAALAASGAVGPHAANVVGFLTAVSVSYVGHRYWTFGATGGAHRRQVPQFLATALMGLAAGQTVLFLALLAGVPPKVALALAALSPPPVTFVLGRFWVFREGGRPLR